MIIELNCYHKYANDSVKFDGLTIHLEVLDSVYKETEGIMPKGSDEKHNMIVARLTSLSQLSISWKRSRCNCDISIKHQRLPTK